MIAREIAKIIKKSENTIVQKAYRSAFSSCCSSSPRFARLKGNCTSDFDSPLLGVARFCDMIVTVLQFAR